MAEIEDVGHEIGRLAATEVEQTILRQQADKLDHAHACPQCGRQFSPNLKEMNKRVKGTEKFWNDGTEGEAILQVKACLIRDDPQLSSHFRNRPGNPFAHPFHKTTQPALT